MAKDPAFLFYPGDYLRDTQCLSEKVQVAYDRIMCEHMRNICISKDQLKFFTKKLSAEEISELKMVLKEIRGGYQIEWVALSIEKRKSYSASRSKNRTSKYKNISNSYDVHMENEIENEIVVKNGKGNASVNFKPPEKNEVAAYMAEIDYPGVVQDEAENFIDFYQGKGWMIGKNKMKDWRATVRTWKKRNNSQSHESGHSKTGSANRLENSFANLAAKHGIAGNGS